MMLRPSPLITLISLSLFISHVSVDPLYLSLSLSLSLYFSPLFFVSHSPFHSLIDVISFSISVIMSPFFFPFSHFLIGLY